MSDLRIEATRGELVESVHRVSVAVVDRAGRLVAESGDPDLVTFWRSAAKPFQAMPLVMDGAADRFGLTPRELALCCASHSSEPEHLATTDSILNKLGLPESALACGPHTPLSAVVAEDIARRGIKPTPRWSNCSGKHAGMLALALHHGWPTEGYNTLGHPVQERILAEVTRWTQVARDDLFTAVDGCNTVCFGLPLRGMAAGYAAFATAPDSAPTRLREAMTGNPEMVGGRSPPLHRPDGGIRGRTDCQDRGGGSVQRGAHPAWTRHFAQGGGRGHAERPDRAGRGAGRAARSAGGWVRDRRAGVERAPRPDLHP
jgi:L-asparaginase II